MTRRGVHRTQYPLAEARVLYELGAHGAHRDGGAAAQLAIDAGQLSRLLKRLETEALVERCRPRATRAASGCGCTARPARTRSRALDEALARGGRRAARTRCRTRTRRSPRCASCARAIEPERATPCSAASSPATSAGSSSATACSTRASTAGTRASSGSSRRSPPTSTRATDRAWIAEVDGERAGAVLCVHDTRRRRPSSARCSSSRARAASASAPGSSTRSSSTRAARGYTTLTLWTNDVLHAARRIYERAGLHAAARGAAPRVRPRPRRADLVPYPASHGPRRTEGAAGAAEGAVQDRPGRRR